MGKITPSEIKAVMAAKTLAEKRATSELTRSHPSEYENLVNKYLKEALLEAGLQLLLIDVTEDGRTTRQSFIDQLELGDNTS